MTVNVIAIPETGWEEELFNSPCYGIFLYCTEEEHPEAPTYYRLHFFKYQIFPNDALEAHLETLEAAAKLAGDYFEDQARHEYLDEFENSCPEYPFDFIRVEDADSNESVIQLAEVPYEEFEGDEKEAVESCLEGCRESLQRNGGYPDHPRLLAISNKRGWTQPEFSQSDIRYIEGAPEFTVERPGSGGLLIRTQDFEFKHRYFFCTEVEARQEFWEYIVSEGYVPEPDE